MHNDTPVTSQGSSHCALAARLTAVLGSLPKPGEVVTDVTIHFLYFLICSPSFLCTVITDSRRNPSAVWEKADTDLCVLSFKIWRQALQR